MTRNIILEVCTGDAASVAAARAAGAPRIELCSGLEAGGLTTTAAVIRQAVDGGGPLVNVLVRPRSGDFVYSTDEASVIEDDIRMCRDCGANGVVIGALTPDGEPDMALMERWVKAADGMSVTFHRAFDLCRDPFGAIDLLAPLADRILTSGMAADALSGAAMLRRLVEYAGDRIAIMAGGGVNPDNILQIARETGVPEIHGTFSSAVASAMTFRRDGVSMSAPGTDEYTRRSSDPRKIALALTLISRQ